MNNEKKKNKILIVDDNKCHVMLLKHYCKQINCETVEVYNGKEALEILNKENIDLMLLDVNMPEMDGFTVLKKVRENDKIKSLPIIIITALPDRYYDEALKAGANDFLAKPIDEVLLITKIKNLLKIEE